jgi:hypothetical protein
MSLEKTCLHRFLGECENCKRNYDENNRPNNYDCRNYHEIKIEVIEVEENYSMEIYKLIPQEDP